MFLLKIELKDENVLNFFIYLFVIYFHLYFPLTVSLSLSHWSHDTFRNTLMNCSYFWVIIHNVILYSVRFTLCLKHNHIILFLLFIRTNIYNWICQKTFGCTQTYMLHTLLYRYILLVSFGISYRSTFNFINITFIFSIVMK